MELTHFESLLDYYRSQGAPGDQQMLIALLRDLQEQDGNVLRPELVERAARALDVNTSLLNALIRRIPSLHPASAPHTLQLCRTCREARSLAAFVEREYGVQSGGVCQRGGFSFELVNCMKNCKAGPSLRWDGQLYPHADEKLIRRLVTAKKTK